MTGRPGSVCEGRSMGSPSVGVPGKKAVGSGLLGRLWGLELENL